MKARPLNKVISLIKEQMVANAAGTGGGFGGSADAKGPTAGFDSRNETKKKVYLPERIKKELEEERWIIITTHYSKD